MKFSQLSALLMVMAFAIVSVVVEASDFQGHHGATNKVHIGHKIKGINTWFNGNDLKGAACYGDLKNQNVNAKDSWHIGAVHMAFYNGGEKTACFQCAKITYKRRSVIVRIIDDCAGCAPNQIDLTSTAFKSLAPLSVGQLNTVYEFVRCPSAGTSMKWPASPKV